MIVGWHTMIDNRTIVLTCAFCGEAYPDGTPATKHMALTEHIKICTMHPMRTVELERDAALAARDAAQGEARHWRTEVTAAVTRADAAEAKCAELERQLADEESECNAYAEACRRWMREAARLREALEKLRARATVAYESYFAMRDTGVPATPAMRDVGDALAALDGKEKSK